MKRLLLTLVVSLTLCGSMFAQETHWPEFNNEVNPYEDWTAINTFIRIDGDTVTANGNWADLEIASFINGECRGHAFMEDGTNTYGDPYPFATLPAYFDSLEIGLPITFKLYDHFNNIEYEVWTCNYGEIVTGIDHIEIYSLDYQNAVVIDFATTQTIALSAGITWVSFNVETTLNDLKAALLEAVPGTAIQIIGQSNSTNFDPSRNRWLGSLTWDVSKMYMIKVTTACEITLQGMPIDPAEHPATVNQGNNWIAFPLGQNMTIINAFSGFAVNGDQISSQTNAAVYTRGRWQGNMSELQSGKGYIYKAVSGPRTLVFPASAK